MLVAWALAQGAKVILGVITEKRFNFRWFVDTGGMPSSHAATVSALAAAVGLKYGLSSSIFAHFFENPSSAILIPDVVALYCIYPYSHLYFRFRKR